MASRSASAATAREYHLDYPAASCYQFGALQIWNGSLINNTSSVQYAECPVLTDDYMGSYKYASAFSTGAANGVSCWFGVMRRNGSGYVIYPAGRSYQSGYESENWGLTFIPQQANIDMECQLQPGTGFTGYTVGQFWNDWNN
ncbi:MAG TPA: hypothetical protein VIF15_13595 [Polyangiaceae bacterium]